MFTDDTHTTVAGYFEWKDSSEWTGMYLGSQAMRYHITGDAQAKANAIRTVGALSGNLHITQTPGYIARFHADQDPLIYPGDTWCDETHGYWCRREETGDFAGQWWWGETSRDMYNGWFFGMNLAYDLVDDEAMRDLIRDDVDHVLTVLMDQNWMILNELGVPAAPAPLVLPLFRVTWLTIGYHITANEAYKTELQKWLRDDRRTVLRLSSFSTMNRYAQFYGNCLSHEYWYNLLRLGEVYFSQDDYEYLKQLFEDESHDDVRLAHNPWFNGVFMSQGNYRPEPTDDPYQAQLLLDLTEFPSAPNVRYLLPDRDLATYTLDPTSVFLADLIADYPFLEDLMGRIFYQAQDPFPVTQQCSSDFMFQHSPYKIYACGADQPEAVNPGVDYLISYWLAGYHNFIGKGE
jgi:hypothetical protein